MDIYGVRIGVRSDFVTFAPVPAFPRKFWRHQRRIDLGKDLVHLL